MSVFHITLTLPVRHGNRTKIIENCVESSDLWKVFYQMTLNGNLRVNKSQQKFKQWLLNVGDCVF